MSEVTEPAATVIARFENDPASVRKIAVLRANAIGDFVFVLPALAAVKQHFPNAELVYLGKAWHRDFLEGRPGPVDRVIEVPICDGIPHESDRAGNPQAVAGFFSRMQAERFDIAFQMHGGGGNSNTFVANLGARISVGFQAKGAPPLDINLPYLRWMPEVLRYLELVSLVGISRWDVTPRLSVTERDDRALNNTLPNRCGPLVLLHPGATDPRRRWSPARFAQTGDAISKEGFDIIVTGSADERMLAGSVVNSMRDAAVNLAGELSLNALLALLSRAVLVVSNDTGPLHLARAVGTPTVGIYWVGNAMTYGPLTAKDNRLCISWQTNCPRCGRNDTRGNQRMRSNDCDHAGSFVDAVTPDEVIARAHELLGTRSAVGVHTHFPESQNSEWRRAGR